MNLIQSGVGGVDRTAAQRNDVPHLTSLLFVFSCLSCLSWFHFFYRLADRDLWSSHEARAAQDAQTILDDGCWGLPRLYDGRVELQKPPLYYWLVAGIAGLSGGTVDAWAVRLPAALSALGCVLVVALLARQRGRSIAGITAAAMLATAVHFTGLARIGRIDMPLTLTVTLALGGYYQRRFLLAYLAVAAGLLLKGPIAAVLPATVIAVHRLLERRLGGPTPSLSSLWWGVPLVVALAAPWYLWANAQTDGELFRVFFLHHNVERGLGGSDNLKAHPWWFYGPQLFVSLLPWSLLLPAATWYSLRQGRWRDDPEARFGLVWLLAVTAVLSCFRFKRADYLLPAYPGAALFLGCVAERWYRTARHQRRLATAFAVVLALCVAGWWVYLDVILPQHEPEWECRQFAAEVRRQAPPPGRVLFFRTEAHALAFHVGRPLETVVDWAELDARLAGPEQVCVVMPAASAEDWPMFLRHVRLEEVRRSPSGMAGGHGKPLVLLRPVPGRLSCRDPLAFPSPPPLTVSAATVTDRPAADRAGSSDRRLAGTSAWSRKAPAVPATRRGR
jgi:hypothetical protein